MLYESARKELKELCGNEKIPSLKQLRAEKEELTLLKNQQYEDYSFSRAKFRELQTVQTNVNSILSKEHKQEKSEIFTNRNSHILFQQLHLSYTKNGYKPNQIIWRNSS